MDPAPLARGNYPLALHCIALRLDLRPSKPLLPSLLSGQFPLVNLRDAHGLLFLPQRLLGLLGLLSFIGLLLQLLTPLLTPLLALLFALLARFSASSAFEGAARLALCIATPHMRFTRRKPPAALLLVPRARLA